MCSATCRSTLTTCHCPHSPAAAVAINRYLLPCPSGPQQQTCSNGSAAVGARWNRLMGRQTDRHRTVSYYTGMHYTHAGAGGGDGPTNLAAPKLWLGLSNLAVLLTHCGQMILRIISKFDATRCQILRLKSTKFDFRWGSAPDVSPSQSLGVAWKKLT